MTLAVSLSPHQGIERSRPPGAASLLKLGRLRGRPFFGSVSVGG